MMHSNGLEKKNSREDVCNGAKRKEAYKAINECTPDTIATQEIVRSKVQKTIFPCVLMLC